MSQSNQVKLGSESWKRMSAILLVAVMVIMVAMPMVSVAEAVGENEELVIPSLVSFTMDPKDDPNDVKGDSNFRASNSEYTYSAAPSPVTMATIFFEDFEGAFPPAGWSTVDNIATGNFWQRNDFWACNNEATNFGSGFSACAESDASGIGPAWDTTLFSPTIDLTLHTTATLTYASNFQDWIGFGEAWCDISTDGGGTWANLWYSKSDEAAGGTLHTHDLTDYCGNNVIFRWTYDDDGDGFAWYWHIDDVILD